MLQELCVRSVAVHVASTRSSSHQETIAIVATLLAVATTAEGEQQERACSNQYLCTCSMHITVVETWGGGGGGSHPLPLLTSPNHRYIVCVWYIKFHKAYRSQVFSPCSSYPSALYITGRGEEGLVMWQNFAPPTF